MRCGGGDRRGAAWAVVGATAAIAPRALRALPTKPNHRGKPVPFPAGLVAAVMSIATAPSALSAGVAVLGLLDDLADDEPRGLRGHITAGRLTTGHLKAVGTAALAAATTRDAKHTAVITLVTHLFNVLDLRPGRAVKVFAAVLALTGDRAAREHAAPLLVIGAYDVRERAMLGDTGATLLGAMAGQSLPPRRATIAVLAAITLLAEVTSLTALIDRVPPLWALDWLGRSDPYA